MIKSNEIVTIYSKFCVPCVKGDDFKDFEDYCRIRNVPVEVRRTTYQPKLHEEATEIWGDEFYTIFVRFRNGKKYDFDEVIKMIKDGKELFDEEAEKKTIRIKKKPIVKGKNK